MPAHRIGAWNAWIFMSVFLLQMLAILLIDRRAWERSHIPEEARRNAPGRHAGAIANLFWLLTLCYSVFVPLRLGTIWFYLGTAVFLAGTAVLIAATIDFIGTPGDRVIARGAYRFSRHPMYVATLLICLGAGIAAASWLLIALGLMTAAYLHREALVEERYCLATYGGTYREYMDRTPRWVGVPRKRDEPPHPTAR